MVLVTAGPDNLESRADRVYVVDFDSGLGKLLSWKDYTRKTFRPDLFTDDSFEEELQSWFRVIPASCFIAQFASDRSHMLEEGSTIDYKMPPPPYEPIVGPEAKLNGVSNNLMNDYVNMTGGGAPGSVVLSMCEFMTLGWLDLGAV
ncbi:hypothetical protein FS749_013889 [Ceratobasidium sp. UAMH 11750]|nr:hypothetical protein FS749_013889 [Ceratobasidium sp. UAMH 11750]